jgi:hypothetical protein
VRVHETGGRGRGMDGTLPPARGSLHGHGATGVSKKGESTRPPLPPPLERERERDNRDIPRAPSPPGPTHTAGGRMDAPFFWLPRGPLFCPRSAGLRLFVFRCPCCPVRPAVFCFVFALHRFPVRPAVESSGAARDSFPVPRAFPGARSLLPARSFSFLSSTTGNRALQPPVLRHPVTPALRRGPCVVGLASRPFPC